MVVHFPSRGARERRHGTKTRAMGTAQAEKWVAKVMEAFHFGLDDSRGRTCQEQCRGSSSASAWETLKHMREQLHACFLTAIFALAPPFAFVIEGFCRAAFAFVVA